MDRVAAMRLFGLVVEAGSLTAGARAAQLPLATVSRRIAALERAVGLPLLRRTARRLVLTEAGRAYLAGSRRILADLEELDASLAGRNAAPSGLVTITAPVAFGRLHVLPIVSDYLRRHAETRVRLLLLDRVVDLVEEGFDLAIRFGTPDESLVARTFGEQRSILCASPDYIERRGVPAEPAALRSHDLVGFAATDEPAWRFASRTSLRVRPRLVVNTAEAAVDAAIAGLGIVRVMHYQAAAALTDGRLVRVLAEAEPEAIPGHVLYPGGGFVPARTRALVDVLLPRLREACRDLEEAGRVSR